LTTHETFQSCCFCENQEIVDLSQMADSSEHVQIDVKELCDVQELCAHVHLVVHECMEHHAEHQRMTDSQQIVRIVSEVSALETKRN